MSRSGPALFALASLCVVAGCRKHGGSAADGGGVMVANPNVLTGFGNATVQSRPQAGVLTASGATDGGGSIVHITKGVHRNWPSCDAGMVDELGSDDAGVSLYATPCLIDEQHGVFADATRGDDSIADGSRDSPFKTLTAAIASAANKQKRVYACLGTYEERVVIGTAAQAGLEVYGGLRCDDFQPDPTGGHALVLAKGKGAALAIGDTHSVVIERIDFENAPGDDPAGATYIGALVQNAQNVVLRDVRLSAAPGKDGADGAMEAMPAASGMPGSVGADACAANPNPGGLATVATKGCVDQSFFTTGSAGGDGAIAPGNGGNGSWYAGQIGGGGETSMSACTSGSNAVQDGYLGGYGTGAKGFGAFVSGAFFGFPGNNGSNGSPGIGGAGGGGARAPASCNTGASGGGGGGGGCGGKGGRGGGAGGSSLGLVLVSSGLWIERGEISYGDGGKGGNGGLGQLGGSGGPGGVGGKGTSGSNAACGGTAGGKGGQGGPGGGGNGGHAIGILYIGDPPKLTDVVDAAGVRKGGASGQAPAGTDMNQAPNMIGTPGTAAFKYKM